MYKEYQQCLSDEMKMDFDDQMIFALDILRDNPDILTALRNQYKYISVDEAQDTSKVQHAIIKLLADGNNIFMVGDEDQSIYGFRGAYPRALLNFRYNYKNPYILRMERNYRSTSQIVDKAQRFITKNKGRYEKNMSSERGEGSDVQLIEIDTKEEQYNHLLNVAKTANGDTAFLYRDNESAVVLIDLFTRNNISFKHKKAEMNFFGNNVVRDIVAYLTLCIDPYNVNAFEQICNHGIIYLKSKQKEYAIKSCQNRHISVFEAVFEQMKYMAVKCDGNLY
jgi:DNA helicase-2/ATP-dependent DNA helicase PcrA